MGRGRQPRPGLRRCRLQARPQRPQSTGRRSRSPSTPPVTDSEFETFDRNVRQIIAAYRPALLTVENEEEAPKFFSGRMSQYLKELRSAIEVAHRHDTKVTNGGITSLPLALITWQRLRNHTSQAAADDFARRTFGQSDGRPGWAGILDDLLAKPYAGLRNASAQEGWDRAKFLIDAYKKPEGKRKPDRTPLDFVNFHWYFKDPKALRQAIGVLEHKTNRKVATTEIGQYDREPQTVLDVLGTSVAEEVRWIVWYDGDGDPAQALHNSDCSLRPNGEAFRDFVIAHPPANTPVPCVPGRRSAG